MSLEMAAVDILEAVCRTTMQLLLWFAQNGSSEFTFLLFQFLSLRPFDTFITVS